MGFETYLFCKDAEFAKQVEMDISDVVSNLGDLHPELGSGNVPVVNVRIDYDTYVLSGDIEITSIKPESNIPKVYNPKMPVLSQGYPTLGTSTGGIHHSIVVPIAIGNPEMFTDPSFVQSLSDQILAKRNIDLGKHVEGRMRDRDIRDLNDRMKGDANFDKPYRDQRDHAEGRSETMIA